MPTEVEIWELKNDVFHIILRRSDDRPGKRLLIDRNEAWQILRQLTEILTTVHATE